MLPVLLSLLDRYRLKSEETVCIDHAGRPTVRPSQVSIRASSKTAEWNYVDPANFIRFPLTVFCFFKCCLYFNHFIFTLSLHLFYSCEAIVGYKSSPEVFYIEWWRQDSLSLVAFFLDKNTNHINSAHFGVCKFVSRSNRSSAVLQPNSFRGFEFCTTANIEKKIYLLLKSDANVGSDKSDYWIGEFLRGPMAYQQWHHGGF